MPLADNPRQPGFWPWMTWSLVAVNVAVFAAIAVPQSFDVIAATEPGFSERLRALSQLVGQLPFVPAQISAYDLTVSQYGFRPGAPSLTALFSSMFLHGDFFHLLGNMVFLLIFGNNVERRLGRVGFLAAYVISGVTATLGFSLLSLSSLIPMIGASGAISGVLGLHFVLYGSNSVAIWVGFGIRWLAGKGSVIDPTYSSPSRLFIAGFVVLDNLIPVMQSAESTVAYGAHLAGFAGGVIVGIWLFSYEAQLGDATEGEDPADPAVDRLDVARSMARQGLVVDAWLEYQGVIDQGVDEAVRVAAQREQDGLALSPLALDALAARRS